MLWSRNKSEEISKGKKEVTRCGGEFSCTLIRLALVCDCVCEWVNERQLYSDLGAVMVLEKHYISAVHLPL